MKTDTIVANATAISNSGIGIIRVSGDESIDIVNSVYRDKKNNSSLKSFESNTIHYGFIYDDEELLDEVMISVFRKPNSFTTEDTVEINCHGGVLIMNRIIELVINHGARIAEPGEFTKRAFLNGRIDLSRAEAVMDLISSQNETALKNSARQLKGSVYHEVVKYRKEIIHEIAFIESALDDPEHISLEGYPEQLNKKVDHLIEEVKRLLLTAENGRIVKEGIHTVIIGKPNVGKSSLLNRLAGEERAIVTEIAGTTRDIIEENIKLNGINLRLIDTAGIHSTDDIVEKIGVDKAKKYLKEADLIVYVVDSSLPLDENDMEIMDMIDSKKCIVLYNKSDLNSEVSMEELKSQMERRSVYPVFVKSSMKENTGIEDFEKAVNQLFFDGKINIDNGVIITNIRHKEALNEVLESLLNVKESLKMEMPEDFYSIDLMSAYAQLGKIIGEEVEEDLVNEIFSKFCMGK